ncbi:hypothetical protein DAPPUDRAFT_97446 [Daphnia pulex]|uniref:Uncharacterized protein n=1 Tax=Daphnia pulex TaxID=6669 RepID=E9G023_DAPPU|nr:hypothetical protein DAPPUDRAFT_97446 [Daphnia pulex]|eukprot:EFX87163.1 hypothetical protein DAPPUDRAFT_97446 [Daphnia pulex]
MSFSAMISMVSSWLFTSTTHQTRQPDNSQSPHILDSPVLYQHQVELKQTPDMERVQFGNFSTRLPSTGLIPPPPYQRGFIPPSSGVVPGNVPSNNAAPRIYPTPPRGPVVMRRPVAERNQDFHPYRRMEEKPKPSVLEPSKGSQLFDSLKELGSMLQDHQIKYPSNMSPNSLNKNNGVCQNIKAQPNYQTVLEYSNDLPTSRESTDGVPKVYPLPDEKDFPSEQPDNHENERKVADYVTPSIYPNEYERLMPETKPEVFEKPESAVQDYVQNRLPEVDRTLSHPTEFYGQQLSLPPMANAGHVPDVSHNTNPFHSAPNLPTSRESMDDEPEAHPLQDEKAFTVEQPDNQENVWMVADSFYVTPSVNPNKYEKLMPETKPQVFEKPQSAVQNYAENLLPEVGKTLSHPTQFYGQQISPPPMANAGRVPDVNHNTTPFRSPPRVQVSRMAEVCIWIGQDLARYSTNPPTPAESGLRREPLKYNPYQQAPHQLTRPKVAPKPNANKPKKAPKPNKPKPQIKPKLQEESEPIPVEDEKGSSGFSLSRWTGDWFKQTAAHPTHLRDETNQSWRSLI